MRTTSLARRLLLGATLAALLASTISSQARVQAPAARARIDKALVTHLRDQGQIPVVIQYQSRPTTSDSVALVKAGFVPPFVRYGVIPAVAAKGSAAAVRSLLDNPRVSFIEYDARLKYFLDRATEVSRAKPTWSAEYSLDNASHTGGFTGRGIGIAVEDSGIDATHPDLLWKPLADAQGKAAKVLGNYKMGGRNNSDITSIVDGLAGTSTSAFIEANTLALDVADSDTTGGHGTHVAGIAAGTGAASEGKYKGAAPGANLYGFGVGETLSITLALAGFDYIHAHHTELGIRIVTNSWGGTTPGDYSPTSAVTKAVKRLVNDDGLVVLFAAGNNGGDGTTIQTAPESNIPEVINVANYYDRRGWLDDSSSRGLSTNPNTWPDLAAPGTQIISTAATGGPVTYVGTGQDAAINHLDNYGEPDVVSIPGAVPVMTEQKAAGQDVIVGPYASFTGTSMATPLVAGVVALMLEANPALTPLQVRTILRETANMPGGRRYDLDGFAVGKGVVDAAEAVAVALKMREGQALSDALRLAYVDSTGSTYKLNEQLPRRLDITSPASGADVSGATLNVSGTFAAGPVTDNSIPLMPVVAAPRVIEGSPHIYQADALDPFVLAPNSTVVAPGEPVSLTDRSLHSNDPGVSMTGATAAAVVKKEGNVVYGPINAPITADGTSNQSNASWSIPADAPVGSYTWENLVTIGGTTYVSSVQSFAIGSAPSVGGNASLRMRAPVGGPELSTGSSSFFTEGFEGGSNGWTVSNHGTGPGLLTDWTVVDDETNLFGTWTGFHGDNNHKMFYAGDVATALAGMSGTLYEHLANTDLISPTIDLSTATSATLEYWRSGQSEATKHFLRVWAAEVATTPAWVKVDEKSGDLFNSGYGGDWEKSVVDLSAFSSKQIKLRFQFDSRTVSLGTIHPMVIGGWFVDDISVTGNSGSPITVITPTFSASPTSGLGSLDTTFTFSAQSNTAISGYAIDFGDGSPVFTKATAGTVKHTYSTGQRVATLTTTAGATTKVSKLAIDVAKVGEVQVRIAGRPWVDAGQADSSDMTWTATLNTVGLPVGPALIEVRHYDASGRLVTRSITVNIT